MIKRNRIFVTISILAYIMIGCNSSDTKEQSMKTNDTNEVRLDIRETLTTFPVAESLFFGEDALGQNAASIKSQKPISKEADQFFKTYLPNLKNLTLYPGNKLTFNERINLYSLYAVSSISYDNVAVYVISLNNEGKVISQVKVAYYEEHKKNSIIEEGCVFCEPSEIQAGSTIYFIDDSGKFIKKSSAPNNKQAFSGLVNKSKELKLPFLATPYDIKFDALTQVDTLEQRLFIKPYTLGISENDYEYPFNYPDFASNEYRIIGRITVNNERTILLFMLFDNGVQFIGAIAYDGQGKIVDGLMLGNEEGGSEVRHTLKSTISKPANAILISSEYTESTDDGEGNWSSKDPIKKSYTFNTSTDKFEKLSK